MRRWLHCVIVALLCLTLCMDSARACWQLRRRSRTCPPPVCPAPLQDTWTFMTCDGCPGAWVHAPQAWHTHVTEVVIRDWGAEAWVDEQPAAQCCVPSDGSAHEGGARQGVVDHATVGRIAPGDAVVVHDPTIVRGAAPAADSDREPQTARPAAPQPQAASQEPLPDLRPASAPQDQPVPVSLDMPEEPATPQKAVTADKPLPPADDMPQPVPLSPSEKPVMPAAPAVDDLAGQSAADKPREENLFDEFPGDEEDAAPDERSAPTEEPEMTEERTTDGDDDAAPASEDAPAVPAKNAPAEDGAAGAVEATACVPVPDEPLRRWTDATGDHHAQGWLVEIGPDEARILKVSGRHTTMALIDLSADDQAYVAAVAVRLAAGRPAAAAANDTAGL